MEKIVPDTSVVINGALTRLIESKTPGECEVIVPLAVIDELQAQASKGREIGIRGLEELKKVREIAGDKGIRVRFSGERPSLDDIKLARSGRIDALIRDVAKAEQAKLYTSDYVQALVAEAEGIPVEYVEPYELVEEFSFERYLRPDVLSLYLRSGSPPYAEILREGRIKRIKLGDQPCDEQLLNRILEEAMAAARLKEEVDISLLRSDALILETSDYRIKVSKPPFSDRLEITIQRNPLSLISESKLVDPIVEECDEGSYGILLLNADRIYCFPIAERIAERLRDRGLRVEIIGHTRRAFSSTPYHGPLNGDLEKAMEFLLTDPPDILIFEEVKKTRDFKIVREFRSAGSSVLAFLTSTSVRSALIKVLDSVKPSALREVFDRIILMRCYGGLEIYRLSTSIKIPTGLSGKLGALPVTEILHDEKINYEIYEAGGSLVIADLDELSNRLKMLEQVIHNVLKKLKMSGKVEIAYIRLDEVGIKVSKRRSRNISKLKRRLEDRIGVRVELLEK
ncbi:MAG: hypothetical protein J7L79_02205 [Thaumarchaeota archaeon]|nr:hypothetical protein [Nitrososphaerota archaeon]